MPVKILILDSDQTTVAWLRSKLESQGFITDTADLGQVALQKIAAAPPDLLLLDFVLPDLDGLEVIRRIRHGPLHDKIAIVVLSSLNKSEVIIASMNAGADAYVVKRPGADVELIAKIHTMLIPSQPATPARRGRIITFCSAKGGSGTTSVTINAADALAKLNRTAETLIVDMVFPLGTVGVALGIEPTQTITQLSQESVIDSATIEKYLSRPTRWGFRVLLGAHDPEEASKLDVTKIQPIFDSLRTMFDFVLVDIGRTLSRISLPLLEMASSIVIVVTPDIATVKSTKHLVQYLESRHIPRERMLVVNNRTVGRVWTTVDDMARELGIPPKLTIPYLVEYMTMAINEAIPFVEKFPENSGAVMFSDLARILGEPQKRSS